jgi:hypothetical protein
MNHLPKARTANIVTQETDKELLIYDLVSNKVLCLNETSKTIWHACDVKTTFDVLRKSTSQDFSDELIFLMLEELQKKNLLSEKIEFEIPMERFSRRKMLAKYGAMAISLPIIVAIVAPTSIMAQSNCQPFTCQTNFVNMCGSFNNNCGGQVTCSCTGIKSCSGTNCLCPDPNTAATLSSVAPFCATRCLQQIFIDSDAQGNLVLGASGCPVNGPACGGG